MSNSQERKVPASNNIYIRVESEDSHQQLNVEPNSELFFARSYRSIVQLANKWTLKEIVVGLIMVCLTLLGKKFGSRFDFTKFTFSSGIKL